MDLKLYIIKIIKKMFFYSVSILIIVTLMACNSKSHEDEIVVTVNGEAIYESQIQNVLNQSIDNPIDRDFLIENSINQLVVVQYGEKSGIYIEDAEFYKFIEKYQKEYPEYYNKGIEIYGEDEFLKGLKYHLIYQETKDKIIDDNFSDIYISDDILNSYLKDKKYSIGLTNDNYSIIKEKYIKDSQEDLFNNWVEEKRNEYQIDYYSKK